ncbi:DUF6415 family natural product biosynthesis protein [Streptomyces torulosus]|uniref:DUF6415 family natural product biosynthesis protein n=1 Tax=Streptomyces torulosus TaxID=68276 RepID=UPI0006EBD1F7|nr:DUF6415 family natural product biosynthesis protein [Streptomyces torulosus]
MNQHDGQAQCETATLDAPGVRRLCDRALWQVPRIDEDEMTTLLEQLEGHVQRLAPEVARLVAGMRDEVAESAMVSLRHADEVLDAAAPRSDAAARLQDLGVAARSLVTLVEMAGEWSKPEKTDRPTAVAAPSDTPGP